MPAAMGDVFSALCAEAEMILASMTFFISRYQELLVDNKTAGTKEEEMEALLVFRYCLSELFCVADITHAQMFVHVKTLAKLMDDAAKGNALEIPD
jgi:hypothetical protein